MSQRVHFQQCDKFYVQLEFIWIYRAQYEQQQKSSSTLVRVSNTSDAIDLSILQSFSLYAEIGFEVRRSA